ncbi:hypothetical protein BC834DRAFT_401414 [Gloeopeniophorella convolvens]|nr:hypothetical protein BC834DRAFT_401414 [Gloeopeniophorella convolvens]
MRPGLFLTFFISSTGSDRLDSDIIVIALARCAAHSSADLRTRFSATSIGCNIPLPGFQPRAWQTDIRTYVRTYYMRMHTYLRGPQSHMIFTDTDTDCWNCCIPYPHTSSARRGRGTARQRPRRVPP